MKRQFWFGLAVVLIITMSLSGYATAQPLSYESNYVLLERTMDNPDMGNTLKGSKPANGENGIDSESPEDDAEPGFFFVPLAGFGGTLSSLEFRYGGLIGRSGSNRGRVFAEYYGDGIAVNNVFIGFEYPLESAPQVKLVPSLALGFIATGYYLEPVNPTLFGGYDYRPSYYQKPVSVGMGIGFALEFVLTNKLAWRVNYQNIIDVLGKNPDTFGFSAGVFIKL
jgi:hypothetical protein